MNIVDPTQLTIVWRLLFAFIAGVIIGFDRERSGKAAGIRTQMLVCVGSALTASISIYLAKYYGPSIADPARLMAQIIAGIGFLGAGVIIKNGNKVSGMTTAATIWITAAIGISIGSGFYLPAIVSVGLVLLLDPIAIFQYRYGLKGNRYVITVDIDREHKLEKILAKLNTDVRTREIKDGKLMATIISSQQRNIPLRLALKKSRINYGIEIHEE